jgi:competence protein ComEA
MSGQFTPASPTADFLIILLTMNRIRSWVRVFFGFSRNETNAFLVLLPLLFFLIIVMPVYRLSQPPSSPDFSSSIRELDSIAAQWKSEAVSTEAPEVDPVELFPFNPNLITRAEMESLGFNNRLAQRLENYRKAGGKFLIKSDLLTLYGFDTSLFQRLYPYIDLPEEKTVTLRPDRPTHEKKSIIKFNLNEADTTQLISVYGIGSRLSQRIVNYRNQLGGFISYNQLFEINRLDSAVINELIKRSFLDENFELRKIDINTANEKELAAHPYISANLAKAIVNYRIQHGPFQHIDQIRQIVIVSEDTFQKIKPYLSINP